MIRFRKWSIIGMLVFTFLFPLAIFAATELEHFGAVEAVEGETLELGKWYHGFNVCKKYAEKNGIPLFIIWTNKGCSVCRMVANHILRDEFKAWQQTEEGQILYCVLAGGEKDYPEDRQKGPAYMWLKNGTMTKFPFVVLYWSDQGKIKAKEHYQGLECESGPEKVGYQNIISHIREAFSGWTGHSQPPVIHPDYWDPTDDTESGATPIHVDTQSVQNGPHTLSDSDLIDWYSLHLSPSLSETNYLWMSDCQLYGSAEDIKKVKPSVSFYKNEIQILKEEKQVEFTKTEKISSIQTNVLDWVITNRVTGVSQGARTDLSPQGKGFQGAFWDQSGTYSFVYSNHVVQVATNMLTYGYETTNVVVVAARTNRILVAKATLNQQGGFILEKGPNLQSGFERFTVDESGKIRISGIDHLQMSVSLDSRGGKVPVQFRYVLHAKKRLEQFAGFAVVTGNHCALTNSVTYPEKSLILQFAVLCGSETRKNFSGKLQFVNDGALRDHNYTLSSATEKLEKGFSWKGNSTNLFQVAIRDDRKWNPKQDFLIRIIPDDPSVHLISQGQIRVKIDEASKPDNGVVSLVSYIDPKTGQKKNVSSSSEIIISEGETISLVATRSGGEDQPIRALLKSSQGGDVLASYAWDRLQGGEQTKNIMFPIRPGFQSSTEYRATLDVQNAGVSSSKKTIRFVVYDSSYDQSISEYNQNQKPDVRMNTRGEEWFLSKDHAYTCFEGGTLTTSLKGPGVFSFETTGNRGGLTAQILRIDPEPVHFFTLDGERIGLVIPSGTKNIELKYQKSPGENNFIALYDLRFTPLSAATEPITPLSRDVLLSGQNLFSWNTDSIRFPGIKTSTVLYRGDTGEELNCGNASSTNLVLTETRSFSWRTSVKVQDYFGHAVQINSPKQSSIIVLDENAPSFDLSHAAPMGNKGIWQENGSGIVFDHLYTKIHVKLGPMALTNGGNMVKKVRGTLPSGLRIETEPDGIFIVGTPSRAVTNSCIFQVSEGRTSGATLPVLFKIAALPADVSGSFIGEGTLTGEADISSSLVKGALSNGVMKVDVTSSGRISGSISLGGKKFSMKADGFEGIVIDSEGKIGEYPAFYVPTELTYGSGRNRMEIPILLTVYSQPNGLATFEAVSRSDDPIEPSFYFAANGSHNFWKDSKKPEGTEKLKALEGYYTALIRPDAFDNFGAGYMTLTVSKNGSVRISGKLPDGTPLSTSGILQMEGMQGLVYFGVNPSSYKGGEYTGSITLNPQNRDVLGQAIWLNRDQKKGPFIYQAEIKGGAYTKSNSYDEIYQMDEENAAIFQGFQFDLEEANHVYALISSNGRSINLEDSGTNQLRINRLSFRVNLSTGIYTGSITLHSKRYSIAGVLTPSFCIRPDGTTDWENCAGGGYCLSPQKDLSFDFGLRLLSNMLP